ncbi:hypothetical protein J2Z17_002062 [Rhizobium halophytocola]|uniref:Uncharacterized protein n=1 Tax=Rhizobium halophytocola TaxID=735519 RepID=A0ABS4DY66_9HYPH|nr:hypothetical protein [Rhizobium halophytocola]
MLFGLWCQAGSKTILQPPGFSIRDLWESDKTAAATIALPSGILASGCPPNRRACKKDGIFLKKPLAVFFRSA